MPSPLLDTGIAIALPSALTARGLLTMVATAAARLLRTTSSVSIRVRLTGDPAAAVPDTSSITSIRSNAVVKSRGAAAVAVSVVEGNIDGRVASAWVALRGFKPLACIYADSITPRSTNVLCRPNSDATPRSIAAEPILRTFSQQLDDIQELQQVAEIECLVVPHAHMAPIRTDRRGGVWDESRHLFHVLGIHLVVASTNSKRLYFDLM
jgi:hypothetical protein